MKSKGKLLIVDDNYTLLESCELWFEEENYEVYTASSGENALKIILKYRIDILITDYSMPGMDGISLISKVIKKYPNIKIIMMTGFGKLDSAKECVRLGVDNYLEKQIELKCVQKDGDIDIHKLQQYVDQGMQETLRIKIVKAMNKSLLLWQKVMDQSYLNSYKADFAEKSNLWQVQNDNGNLRTRGLDRYLDINKLPLQPKKNLILNSIKFVLNEYKSLKNTEWQELNELYKNIEELVWVSS
ncbi:MAG: response regulator [Desulfobacteraceae bacterium]|nr:response regulator [Desulfobacteraceae bacterium]